MSRLILPYHAGFSTLAHIKSQPLFSAASWRDFSVADVAKWSKTYVNSAGAAIPETEALRFYAGNAVFAEIQKRFTPHQPLPRDVLTLATWYLNMGSAAAQRLLYYLVLIITRESRHVYLNATFSQKMKDKWGEEYYAFNKYMHGASGSMAAKDLFFRKPPDMKLGDYAEAIAWTFHQGGFSSGFGGAKWGQIADVFKDVVNGKLSPEMATDVSWALCHNGGPIFNKGMVYTGYDNYKLKLVLDVQRAGQIPELILSPGNVTLPAAGSGTIDMLQGAKLTFPEAFMDAVDWVKVKNAGAVQSYSGLAAAQADKQKQKGKSIFYVTPDVWVEVKDRVAA